MRNIFFQLVVFFFFMISMTERAFVTSKCSTSSQCSGSKICISGSCKSCRTNSDCSGAVPTTPYCYSTKKGNSCVQCLTNAGCTSATASRCSSRKCTSCSSDSDCTQIAGNKKKCSSGQCVECTVNSDCTTNICDTGAHQCQDVQCTTYTQCTTPTFPYCDGAYCRSCGVNEAICTDNSLTCAPDGSCMACFDNTQCTNAATSRCDVGGTNQCVICQTSDDCSQVPNLSACSSTLGCVECVFDTDCTPGSTCTNNACIESATPLVITLATTSSADTYTITFPSALVTNTDVISGITITLANVDSSLYTYTITMISATKYSVQFTVTKTIPVTTLQLVYMYTPYGTIISTEYDAEIATKIINYIPAAQLAFSQAMQAVGQTAAVAMTAVSSSMMILGGNPAIMWALINLIQTFYYLIFVNVNYPANVQFFLNIFSIGGFDWIPNPMEWVYPDIQDIELPTPQKFEDNEIYGLFLENSGNMLLIWAVVFGLYGVAALGNRYLNRMSNIFTTIFGKIVFWFEWGGVLRALITSYPDTAQSAFLQLKVLTYESSLLAASSVTGIMFAAHSIAFPFLMGFLVKKYIHKKSQVARKYSTLTDEFTLEGFYPKYFNAIFLFKRCLILATLVFLHDHPYLEIFILTGLGILTFIFLCKLKPYETKKSNYLNIATEVLFFGVHMIIMVLIHDDQIALLTDNERLNLGWILIGICGIIVLLNFGSTIVDQILMVKEALKLLTKLRSKDGKPKKKKKNGPLPMIFIHEKSTSQFELESSSMMSYNATAMSASVINTSINSSIQEEVAFVKGQNFQRKNKIKRPNKVQDISRKESQEFRLLKNSK